MNIRNAFADTPIVSESLTDQMCPTTATQRAPALTSITVINYDTVLSFPLERFPFAPL